LDLSPLLNDKFDSEMQQVMREMSDIMREKRENGTWGVLGIEHFIPRPGTWVSSETSDQDIMKAIALYGDFPVVLKWNIKPREVVNASEYLQRRRAGEFEPKEWPVMEENLMDERDKLKALGPQGTLNPEIKARINQLNKLIGQFTMDDYLREVFVHMSFEPVVNYDEDVIDFEQERKKRSIDAHSNESSWYKIAQSQELFRFFQDVTKTERYDRRAKKGLKQILKQEFDLAGIPINTQEYSSDTMSFVLDNYDKLLQATQRSPALTWGVIFPQEDLELLDSLLNSHLNHSQEDMQFLGSLSLDNPFNLRFYSWALKNYKSQDAHEAYAINLPGIYNWASLKQVDPTNHSLEDVYYMMQDENMADIDSLESLPKGRISDWEIRADGETFFVVQLRTKQELNHEGDVMSHCVGSYYQKIVDQIKEDGVISEIYSLRDLSGRSHATIEIQYPLIQQIQGYDNTPLEQADNPVYANVVNQWTREHGLVSIKDVLFELKSPNIPDYTEKMEYYQNIISSSRDAEAIYEFASNVRGANVALLQEALLKTKSIDTVVEFARNVAGADVATLQEFIINEAKHPSDIFVFANNVKNVDVLRLQEALIASIVRDVQVLYLVAFAENVEGADLLGLQDAVIEFGVTEEIYRLAVFFSERGLDVSKLQTALINKNDTGRILDFAATIPSADIPTLQELVIASGSVLSMCEFAIKVPGADIPRLQELVVNSGNMPAVLMFAKDVRSANIPLLQQATLNSGSDYAMLDFAYHVQGSDFAALQREFVKVARPEYLYRWAKIGDWIEKVDVPLIEDALIRSGDVKYIYQFATDISRANIPKLQEAIINIGDIEYINLFINNVRKADKKLLAKARADIAETARVEVMRQLDELSNRTAPRMLQHELA